MELYLDQLHSFKLMRKRVANSAAWLTFVSMLLDLNNPLMLRIPETMLYGYTPTPQLIYTGSKGVRVLQNALLQQLSDFIKLCGGGQNSDFRIPLCVARQEENVSLVMDTLGVASLWHKCTTSKKQLALQRYILSPGGRQLVAQARWKIGKTTIEVFAAKHLHFDRHSFLKLSTSTGMQERFLPRADTWQPQSEGPNLDQLIDMMNGMALSLRRFFSSSNFSEVEEFCCEFVLDEMSNWYFLTLRYYELDRKPKDIKKALQRTHVTRSMPVSRDPSPKKTRKEAYKQLSFEVSPFELRQAVKMHDRHGRFRRQASTIKRTRSSKILKSSVTLSKIQFDELSGDEAPKKQDEMLPIFQFPTPKTPMKPGERRKLTTLGVDDDGLRLMNCTIHDRISLIRDYIVRQNNSLYSRIHYQNELPEKRFLREAYRSAMDKVVDEMEKLVSKARVARVTLNQLRSRDC